MKDVNVPEGYKSTDISVIPKDWKEYYLTELGILERGKSKHRPRWAEHLYGGNYPFIQTGEVTAANKYITKYNKTYSEAGLAQSKLWAKGTLCITIAANIAETAILNFSACFPDSILGFVPSSKKANVEFVFYTINYLQERIKELAISSAQDNINLGTFQKLKLPLPPLPEQKAIARVLSDVDELIRECDSLLAKKRDIKQGTMQLLLTGKKRLPGFSGEWEVEKLNNLCSHIIDGTHYTPKYVNDGIPFYSVENVTGNNFKDTKFISQKEHQFLIKRCNPKKGDILLTRIGTLGITKLIDWDINGSIYVSLALLKIDNEIDSDYLYCYTKSSQFVENIRKRSLVNATPQKINMGDIGDVPIFIPPTLSEQKEIARILSDMDAEIEALEQKRDKYKAIKQGMMQELLTGKTRLIDS